MNNKNYTITSTAAAINRLAEEYAFIGRDFVRTEYTLTLLAYPPKKVAPKRKPAPKKKRDE